jgi:penicillin-binding protein 1B
LSAGDKNFGVWILVAQERKKVKKWSARIKSMGEYPPSVKWGIGAFLLLVISFFLYVGYLDSVIRQKFEGKRWSLPAVVYARPLELYPGLEISIPELEDELQLAGYRRDIRAEDPGGYDRQEEIIHLVTREFNFPDGLEKSEKYTLYFAKNALVGISRTDVGEKVDGLRIDPARIGSFHPKQHEDRIVLSREELPELLVKGLLAVEDHNFFSHSGLDLRAILRALLVNTMAGETLQGGSTLTQQLVKNLFLTNERTIWRKFNEAIMALLLEAHYDKDEILTAYANEIFLGQDGGRAVHGFGLASFFYFRRDLKDLSPAQTATLVGMVQGPSFYNPRKYPERCLKRREIVLNVMRTQKVIDELTYNVAMAAPLDTQAVTGNAFNRFPAFLDLVRRQLAEDYREEALTSDGLKIFSTLDPQVQKVVEQKLEATIARLEENTGISGLDGAVVITRRESGEVLAIAGGRTILQSGFNRALAARRQVGSLIKPAVYLAALGKGFTLATPVDDTALTLSNMGGESWSPVNFDRIEHGRIPMYRGLAYSMNLATVRIGMNVGVGEVLRTVKDLGVNGDFPAYPSFLLGALSLTPLEVAQMYQTLASGGFYLPQRVISTVLAADNTVVKRFGISVEQRFPPEQVYLLNNMLQHVVSEGTAKSLSRFLSRSYNIAGKTGTSDDLRDSWFAGFTGDQLAVVWIGRDDNKPTGLTGASGALEVWGEIMRALHPQPLDLLEPEGIKWQWLKPETFELSSFPFLFAPGQVKLPFIAKTLPGRSNSSAIGPQD